MKQFINDHQWDRLDLGDTAAHKVIADGVQLLSGHKHNTLSSHIPVVNPTCVHDKYTLYIFTYVRTNI